MAMHTGDDKYAVIEISNMELDRLIAAREEQRAKLAAYRAAGSDATLCQFGFDMGEPIRPMD